MISAFNDKRAGADPIKKFWGNFTLSLSLSIYLSIYLYLCCEVDHFSVMGKKCTMMKQSSLQKEELMYLTSFMRLVPRGLIS